MSLRARVASRLTNPAPRSPPEALREQYRPVVHDLVADGYLVP